MLTVRIDAIIKIIDKDFLDSLRKSTMRVRGIELHNTSERIQGLLYCARTSESNFAEVSMPPKFLTGSADAQESRDIKVQKALH